MKTLSLLLFLIMPGKDANLTTRNLQKNDNRGLYQFDKFVYGKVYLRSNMVTTALMNYNYMYGAVQFIDLKGDTLLITNQHGIKYITIGDAIFYPYETGGDVQWLADYGKLKLARKKYLTEKGSKASGSEQKYAAGFDALTPSTLLISNQDGEFQWQNNMANPSYKYKYTYFIMDQNGRLLVAGKSNFLKIFAKRKSELQNYFREHQLDFQNEQHLNQLLTFCSTL